MYAIIATGGKQYKVEEGRFVDVELLPQDQDQAVVFEQVLLIADGDNVAIGAPTVQGATVTGKVILSGKKWIKRFRSQLTEEELAQKGRPGLHPKVIIYKQRPKKHYRRKRGHRQPFTRVLIESIAK
ncbi:MAG: 50S ribosomal protein L21 [Candidatus Sericytochromatia bacterium]|nr:50S ribosomal protein L21 [Candidatus Sericytochromatia bacterium]